MSRERLTVTVDSELALAERAAKERRLRALAEAVAAYEDEFGEMMAGELAAQERADRNAVAIRPRRLTKGK